MINIAAGLLAPTFELNSPTPTSIEVAITPADGTSATSYQVRYSSVDGTFADPLDYTTITREGTFTLEGLENGTEYFFQVAALNAYGSTAYSATQSTQSGDADAAAYDARLISAGRTPNSDESQANAALGRALREAGLTSAKVELWGTGWGVAAANRLKFFSGSCTETGTNIHAAGGLTFAGGRFRTGLNPSTNGWAGMGCYIKSAVLNTDIVIDMGCHTGSTSAVNVIASIGGDAYADYGNWGTARKSTTSPLLPGLYSTWKGGEDDDEVSFDRSTSGGTSNILTSTISGGVMPNLDCAFGGGNINGSDDALGTRTFAGGFYIKATLTPEEYTSLIDIFITWLLALGWIT